MKIKYILILWLVGLFTNNIQAQNVGIGIAAPHTSAKLHIEDTNRGLMIPRVSLTDVTNATTPVNAPLTGLLVFNTNAGVTGGNGIGFYYWDGSIWKRLQDAYGDAWLLTGNAATNPNVNFVGTTDVQPLVFRTNNTENMRINTNGNVGIGTTLATAKLYANIAPTDNTTYGMYISHGGTAGVKYGVFNDMQTTSTSAKYALYNSFADVQGTKYGMLNSIGGTNTGVIYGVYNAFSNSSNSARYGIFNTITNATGQIFGVYNNITPGAANASAIYGWYNNINNSGTGVRYGIYSNVPGGTNAYAAVFNAGHVVFNEVGGDYDFRIEGDTDPNNFFLDASTNNIGIGQGIPVEKLHINAPRMLMQNGSDAIYCSYNTISGFRFELVGSYPGWDNRAVYLGGYNVNNPGGGTYSNANKIYCGGDFGSLPIYATAFINVSSGKLKQNISSLTYGLAEIMKINPVKYQYTFDKSGVYQLGFIAEEMAEVVPELVAFHDEENNIASNGKAMGIDYSKMTAVLVKAVQEQQEMIATQNEQLKKLQEENTEFRQALEQLKNKD